MEKHNEQQIEQIRKALETLDRSIVLPQSLQADTMRYRLEASRVRPRRSAAARRLVSCVLTLAVAVGGVGAWMYTGGWQTASEAAMGVADAAAPAAPEAMMDLYNNAAKSAPAGVAEQPVKAEAETGNAAPMPNEPIGMDGAVMTVRVDATLQEKQETGTPTSRYAADAADLAAAFAAAPPAAGEIALAMSLPQQYSTAAQTMSLEAIEQGGPAVQVQYRSLQGDMPLGSFWQQGEYLASHLYEGILYVATLCTPSSAQELSPEQLPLYGSTFAGEGQLEQTHTVIPAQLSGQALVLLSAVDTADPQRQTVVAVLTHPQQIILRQASCELLVTEAAVQTQPCRVLLEFDGTSVVLAE